MNQILTASTISLSTCWTLAYDPGRHVIRLDWHRPCELPDARPGYEQLLRLARRYNCARWLLDNRQAGPPTAVFLNWLAQDFLPQAAGRLAPRPLRLAVVSSPGCLVEAYQNPALAPTMVALQAPRRPPDGRSFTDEGTAVAWLLTLPG